MLEYLASFGPFFAVGAHRPGTGASAPWRPLRELTEPTGPLRARVEAVRAALAISSGRPAEAIEPRVAASVTQLGLVARLLAPAVAAAASGRGLDMRLGELWWQDTLGGPVPLSVPATVGASPPLVTLLEEVIAPLTAATSSLVSLSPRVLWGNVASAANTAAAQVAAQRPDLGGPAWAEAATVFASARLSGERQRPGPAFRRSSCCLIYRAAADGPRSLCGDCVLRPVPPAAP